MVVVAVKLEQPPARFLFDRRGLIEAPEHGQQPGPSQRCRWMRTVGKSSVERSQCLVGRSRARGERELEPEQRSRLLSCKPRITERPLGCLGPVAPAAPEVRHPVAEPSPNVHEPGVISGALEQRKRLERERLELVDIGIGFEPRAVEGSRRPGELLA